MTTDRVLVLVLVFLSANPVFDLLSNAGKAAALAGFAGVLLAVMHRRRIRPTGRDLAICAAFGLLAAAHLAAFGTVVAEASAAFLVRLAVALLAVRVVAGFPRHFVWAMYWLACISFVFYVPVLLGVDLAEILRPLHVPMEGPHAGFADVFIHNFHRPETATRNSGMFHEPGAFGGHLVLAILLDALEKDPGARRRHLVLLAGVASTLSTVAYIALAPVGVMLVIARQLAATGRVAYRWVVPAVALVAAVAWLAFDNLPFMKSKIEDHLSDVAERKPWASVDRVGNLLYDVDFVAERPLTGWSPRASTRSTVDAAVLETVTGQGNGLSGFAVKYGLLGLGAFAVAAYGSFRRLYGNAALAGLAVCVIAIVLNGEQYLQEAIFLTVMFIPRPTAATVPARWHRRAAEVRRPAWWRPPGAAVPVRRAAPAALRRAPSSRGVLLHVAPEPRDPTTR